MENSFLQSPSLYSAKRFWPWLVGGGIFVILFLVLGIGYWRYQTDHLVKFAPVDSLVYAHFRNPLGFWPKTNITQLPFSFWYQYINDRFEQKLDFQKDILDQTNEAAVLFLPTEDPETLSLVILARLSPRQVTGRLADLPQRQISAGVFAFSLQPKALAKITAVADGLVLPLALEPRSSFFQPALFSLYLNAANLKSYLSSANFNWSALSLGQWQVNLKRSSVGWRFGLQTNQSDLISAVSRPPRPDFLPADFIFYTNSFDFSDLVSIWLATNQELVTAGQQLAANFFQHYGFSFQSQLGPIFYQPAQLIIFASPSPVFGFDFALLLPAADQTSSESLEQFWRILLAQKLPRPVVKTLPDGSRVTELLVQPESFTWQPVTLTDNITARVLSEPRLDFSLAYIQTAGHLIISSSLDHLRSLMTDSGFSLIALEQRCGLKNFSPLAVFNNQNQASSTTIFNYLPQGIIALGPESNQALVGCLVDN